MFALCATLLLCLMSVSDSAPVSCEDLVRPLDQLEPQPLQGRWVVVAGSLKDKASLSYFKRRDSITIDFTYHNGTSNASSEASYTQINRFGERCQYLPFNISIEGTSLTFNVGHHYNITAVFLQTSCPDCMVVRFDLESRNKVSMDLYLVSRRREVGAEEMEEYKAQVECLQLPPPAVMDSTKELCPEQPANPTPSEPAAAQTEEKTDKEQAEEQKI